MNFKFSLNVLVTKIKAMYALRIKDSDYENMFSLKSAQELVDFLKSNSFYAGSLISLPEHISMSSASIIKRLLKHKFLNVLELIYKYEKLLGGYFYLYVLAFLDSMFIMECFERVLDLKAGSRLRYNSYGKGAECFNSRLLALKEVKSVEDFFNVLKNTNYKKLFKNIDLNKDVFYIQSILQKKLYEDLYEKLFFGISKIKNKKVKNNLFNSFKAYLELKNFTMTVRLKRLNKKKEEFLPVFESFKDGVINKLRDLNLESEQFEFLKNSYLSSGIKDISYSYLEQLPEKFLYNVLRKNMNSFLDASVVVVSFINLLKIEINNITKIIEGKSFNLPVNKLRELVTV